MQYKPFVELENGGHTHTDNLKYYNYYNPRCIACTLSSGLCHLRHCTDTDEEYFTVSCNDDSCTGRSYDCINTSRTSGGTRSDGQAASHSESGSAHRSETDSGSGIDSRSGQERISCDGSTFETVGIILPLMVIINERDNLENSFYVLRWT